jgi:hypothetical protein
MLKTKIHPPKKFDWSGLSIEMFRGPSLSFPISMEILIAPSFNSTVLSAVNAFVEDFSGHPILDAEDDSFETSMIDFATEPDGTIHELDQNSFGLRMTYICEAEKVVLLTLGKPKNLITWH